jgi:hypothetical protein
MTASSTTRADQAQGAVVDPRWVAFVTYLVLTVVVGFLDYRVRGHVDHVAKVYIPQVLDGSYGAPTIYRVLAPWLIERTAALTGLTLMQAFLVTRLLVVFVALLVFDRYLRTWFTPLVSLAGTVAMTALLPLTLTNSYPHPDSFPELLLFTAGCLAIARGHHGWLVPIVAIATLNRETAAFLVLLWASLYWRPWPDRRFIGWGLAIGAAWATVYVGLRAWRGVQHYQYWMVKENLGVLGLLPANFDPYTRASAYFWILLAAPLLWLAFRARRRADLPVFLRRSPEVGCVTLVVGFLFAAVIESRVFTPLLPLLVPAALASLVGPAPGAHRAVRQPLV